jgi:hypothetical protein
MGTYFLVRRNDAFTETARQSLLRERLVSEQAPKEAGEGCIEILIIFSINEKRPG